MDRNFRNCMRWLHTWLGLILGWVLFAVFVTGTASYFKDEINLWMKPELHKSQVSSKSMDIAIEKASLLSKDISKFNINLPAQRSNVITINYRENTNKGISQGNGQVNNQKRRGARGQGAQRAKGKDAIVKGQKISQKSQKRQSQDRGKRVNKYFDASTGEELNTRETAGGNFLYRFHYQLHGIPKIYGKWIVAIAAMAMLMAIITGILIHKRIFKDIFTFRPHQQIRNWMDGHILPAVAALPFLIMIAYSSLILSINFMMPWAIESNYKNSREYRQDLQAMTNPDTNISMNNIQRSTQRGVSQKGKREGRNNSKGVQRGKGGNSKESRGQRKNQDRGFQSRANSQKGQGAQRGKNRNPQRQDKGQRTKRNNLQNSVNTNKTKKQVSENSDTKNYKTMHRILKANAKREINTRKIDTQSYKTMHRIVNTKLDKTLKQKDLKVLENPFKINKENLVKSEINTQNYKTMQRILDSKFKRTITMQRDKSNNIQSQRAIHRIESAKTNRIIHMKGQEENISLVSNSKRKKTNKNKRAKKTQSVGISKEDLTTIVLKANKIWPDNIGAFSISTNKRTNSLDVIFWQKETSSIFNLKNVKDSLIFDGKTKELKKKLEAPFADSTISITNATFENLHQARFANTSMRFIFLILGISGIIIIATGLVLWTKKRQKKYENKTNFGFWLVEKLNITTISGIFIALGVYFLANRLISLDIENRASYEISAFFIAWLLALFHALIRKSQKAWKEQFIFATKLFLLIPIVNLILWQHGFNDYFSRDIIFVSFDLFFLVLAGIFAFITSIIRKKEKSGNKNAN